MSDVTTEPTLVTALSATPYVPRMLLRHLQDDPDALWWSIDGSVVFVDISGFTKLSEKLARIGKEGAEQVTDAIETCFTDLLAVAYANEGSLIKFGGDALLLLFEGDAHVENATRSAVWMRRSLRDVGRIEIPGGSHLQLRMSVGAHTDTYHFFHVGRSHRELVVTGKGWTGTVAMEHEADAGEILLSREIASRLPARCLGEPKGEGVLLKREPPGHYPAAEIPQYDVDPDAVAHCLSTAVRSHVLAGGGTPEHRQVSVAFIHYDGTDDMIVERGPQQVAEDLQDLVGDVQDACDEFGVCFLSTDADDNGGKIILTAGAPTNTGNDEERMLLALRKIADRDRAIPIRIGVNKGAVFAGDIGPWYRRTYTVMGDAVNLAARLMAKATPGQIFATAEVLDASGTRFAATELEPFMVKGKAKPVQAWAVGEAIGSRTRDASVKLPLIGRDKELAELREALRDARAGHGSLIEIVGEPGIGKTRLVEELHAEHEARVLFATAEAFTSSTPYVIWRELLREMLGIGWESDDQTVIRRLQETIIAADPSLVPWLPLLAIPLDITIAPTPEVEQLAQDFRQSKLHEVVGRFLEATMRDETLIHVEDAHLMDGASSDLLGALVNQIGDRPWLFTLTRRETGAGFVAPEHDRVRSIRLDSLGRDDIVRLVEAATDEAPLLPHDVSLVADRAAGNPQFAIDLVQVVSAGGMLPESIETAAMSRIDALAPADRALVRRVSVIGVSFPGRFVSDVLPEDAAPPDPETWERLSEFFVDDGDGYVRFRRAVVRDAAYSGLPFRTRRELHARVADRFETELNAEEAGGLLSLHYFLAGDFDKAWGYARTAAKRASDQFAHQEAAQLLQRAIDAGKHLREVGELEMAGAYEDLGDARYRASEYDRAAAAFSMAAKRVDDPVVKARLLLHLAWIEENRGRYAQSLRWITRGLKMLEGVPGSEAGSQRSRLLQFRSTILLSQGKTSRSVEWAEQAAEEARAAGDQLALARAFDSLDWANVSLGKPSGGYWTQALEIYRDAGDVGGESGILLNLGFGCFYEGRWDEALTAYEGAKEGRMRVGDPVMASLAADNIAEILVEQGKFSEAETSLRESLRVWRASGNRVMTANCQEVLSRVLSRTGRFEEALMMLEESRKGFADAGAQEEVVRARARVAETKVLMLEAKAALELADASLAAVANSGEGQMSLSLLERTRGYARAQIGDTEAARQALEASLKIARDRGEEYEAALSLLALARLASLDGTSDAPLSVEAGDILLRLGVIAVPVIPIPDDISPE